MKSNSITEASQTRSFRHDRRLRYGHYLSIGVGLAFIYVVLAHDGGRPFSNFVFPLILSVALLDVVGGAALRAKSPRAFHLNGDKLTIEWAGDALSVSVNEVHRRAFLSLFLTSGSIFTVSKRTFAVFKDLEDYEEFVALHR